MSHIVFALQIDTGAESDGDPISEADAGLYDSSFCLVTGRPGYTGLDGAPTLTNPPLNPFTSAPMLTWKEGILAKNPFGSPSSSVAVSEGGSLASMSGADTSIAMMLKVGSEWVTFSEFLRTKGINPYRKTGTIYCIIDNEFFFVCRNLIDSPAFDDALYKLAALDESVTAFNDVPNDVIDAGTYPTAPHETSGTAMPLAMGRIAKAELVPVSGVSTPLQLGSNTTGKIYVAKISAFTFPNLTISTPNLTLTNDMVAGKYVSVVMAGTSGTTVYAVRIIQLVSSASGITVLKLSDYFKDTSQVVQNPQTSWWIAIYDISNFCAVSEAPISGFYNGFVYGWNDDRRVFINISNRVISKWPNAGYSLYPKPSGMLLRPETDAIYLQPERTRIIPDEAVAPTNSLGNPDPNLFGTMPLPEKDTFPPQYTLIALNVSANLITGNSTIVTIRMGATSYSTTATVFLTSHDATMLAIRHKIELLPNVAEVRNVGNVISIRQLFQTDFEVTAATTGGASQPVWQAPYGTSGANVIDDDAATSYRRDFVVRSSGPTPPGSLSYNSIGAPICYFDIKLPQGPLGADGIPVGFKLEDTEKLFLAMDFDLFFSSSPGTSPNYQSRFRVDLIDAYGGTLVEGTFADYKSETLSSLTNTAQLVPIHGISGDYYPNGTASEWNAKDVDPAGNIEKYLRNPEFARSVSSVRVFFKLQFNLRWNTVGTYPIYFSLNEIALVRNMDSYRGKKYTAIYGAKFGPTWSRSVDPAAAPQSPADLIEYLVRVQNGRGDLIDPTSFVAMNSQRSQALWTLGNQLREKGPSATDLEEILKAAFICLVPGNTGLRRLRRLDYAVLPLIETIPRVDESLLQSIGPAQSLGMDRVFSSYDLKYALNPATGDYDGRLAILNEERDEFPEASDPEWKAWAIGTEVDLFGNQIYASAKARWDECHAAFLEIGSKNTYTLQTPWIGKNLDFGSSTPDAIFGLAALVADYLMTPWIEYAFTVPITSTTIGWQIMDLLLLGHQVRTDGRLYYVLITDRTVNTSDKDLSITFRARRRTKDVEVGPIDEPTPSVEAIQDSLPGVGIEDIQDSLPGEELWRKIILAT